MLTTMWSMHPVAAPTFSNLMAVAGIVWGIAMATSHDHSAMPAHAHLNLLGWVSLFLFGTFYHLHPAIDGSRTAIVQVWIWIVATVSATAGVGLLTAGHQIGEPLAAVGSPILLADMLLFGWLVYRRDGAGSTTVRSATAAR